MFPPSMFGWLRIFVLKTGNVAYDKSLAVIRVEFGFGNKLLVLIALYQIINRSYVMGLEGGLDV
jgi:hypothetical protein